MTQSVMEQSNLESCSEIVQPMWKRRSGDIPAMS